MLFSKITFFGLLPFAIILWISTSAVLIEGLQEKDKEKVTELAQHFIKGSAYTILFTVIEALLAQNIWG